MGGGSYGYAVRRAINSQQYSDSVSREEVFRQTKMSEDMNIRDKIRECKDSEEHPDSFPIIIALDVTGSMGYIPDNLIRTGLPDIMQKILESGVKDPQVCFIAIGDQYTDRAPIQVGQFESSDDLMDRWLKTVWLEGCGGGNGGESYQFAWYFARYHTSCDWISKGNKGVLITIGDDAVHKSIINREIKKFFGEEGETVSTKDLLSITQEQWDVYHITVSDHQGLTKNVIDNWNTLLKDNHIRTESSSGNDIPELIAGIILSCYNKYLKEKSEKVSSTNSAETEHLL